VLATNENDVLDEFFRTARYRPRRASETRATSSPSMDISKASNFERFIFDVVDRSPQALNALWDRLEQRGDFDLANSPHWDRVVGTGFVSGCSTHADRIATIRDAHARYGVIIDPHTADGLGVGRAHRNPSVPLVCFETASPAKFATTIREALSRDPERPPALADLERRPQKVVVLPANVERVKEYIVAHAAPAF
jgi:threonine synthase